MPLHACPSPQPCHFFPPFLFASSFRLVRLFHPSGPPPSLPTLHPQSSYLTSRPFLAFSSPLPLSLPSPAPCPVLSASAPFKRTYVRELVEAGVRLRVRHADAVHLRPGVRFARRCRGNASSRKQRSGKSRSKLHFQRRSLRKNPPTYPTQHSPSLRQLHCRGEFAAQNLDGK